MDGYDLFKCIEKRCFMKIMQYLQHVLACPPVLAYQKDLL
jgi:hypothetical protein